MNQWPGLRAGQKPKRKRQVSFRLGKTIVTARLEVKWAEVWVGARREKGEYDYLPQLQAYDLWVCLVPWLPLCFHWSRYEPREAEN